MSPYKAFLESCPVESRLYCQWWKAARLPFTVGTPNYKSANTLRPFLFSLNVAWAPLLFALLGAEHVNSRGLRYPPKRVNASTDKSHHKPYVLIAQSLPKRFSVTKRMCCIKIYDLTWAK